MGRSTAAQRRPVEILRRPEGGAGETRPCVSPDRAAQIRREVVTTLHQLIDTLTALEVEAGGNDASEVGEDLPLLLNAVDAGKLLSISRAKVLDLAARGQLPSVRIGSSVRVPRDRLIAWIDGRSERPTQPQLSDRPFSKGSGRGRID
jgi:excisionase family DNA binding protein